MFFRFLERIVITRRLALATALCALATPAPAAEGRDPHQHFFASGTDDFRAELADAKRGGKKALFVMFEQDGCAGCIYMKERVLNRRDVQKFYRERFLNFSINIYGAVPLEDFDGRKVTEKAFARATGIRATPTLMFYDLEGREIVRITGAIRDAGEFILLGEFVASGAYRTRKFAEFVQERRRMSGG
jgi:thioredoxin-related protein